MENCIDYSASDEAVANNRRAIAGALREAALIADAEREFLIECADTLETEGYGARARALRYFAGTGFLPVGGFPDFWYCDCGLRFATVHELEGHFEQVEEGVGEGRSARSLGHYEVKR